MADVCPFLGRKAIVDWMRLNMPDHYAILMSLPEDRQDALLSEIDERMWQHVEDALLYGADRKN